MDLSRAHSKRRGSAYRVQPLLQALHLRPNLEHAPPRRPHVHGHRELSERVAPLPPCLMDARASAAMRHATADPRGFRASGVLVRDGNFRRSSSVTTAPPLVVRVGARPAPRALLRGRVLHEQHGRARSTARYGTRGRSRPARSDGGGGTRRGRAPRTHSMSVSAQSARAAGAAGFAGSSGLACCAAARAAGALACVARVVSVRLSSPRSSPRSRTPRSRGPRRARRGRGAERRSSLRSLAGRPPRRRRRASLDRSGGHVGGPKFRTPRPRPPCLRRTRPGSR